MSAVPVTDTERVWTQFHTRLRAFVSRRVRNPADVDDVVQRVFLQVHRALPTLRDADRIHAWLYQTTRRAIIDYYRAPARRREVPVGDALDTMPGDIEAASARVGDEPSAERELAACLEPLVAELAEVDRQALRLVDVDGLTHVEAARQLGMSVSGMKSRVQRARSRLRAVVEACCRVELDRRGGLIAYEPNRGDACGPCD